VKTADTAPADTPILVWVRDIGKKGEGEWRLGRAYHGEGLPSELRADCCHGNWVIPYWHPLPHPPE
jgi:hypothetical protein